LQRAFGTFTAKSTRRYLLFLFEPIDISREFSIVDILMKKFRILLLLVFTFLAGSFATLLIPVVIAHGGDTNLIHGCVRNNGLLAGFVRIVGANTNCNGNETALDWPKTASSGNSAIVCVGCYSTDLLKRLNEPDLTNVNLDLAILTIANLTNQDLTDSSFIDTVARAVNAESANFTNTDFTGANIRESGFANTNFTNANFTNVSATQVSFPNSNLTNANFTGANLQYSDGMNTATRTGVTWSNTICPDGTNSDNNGNTCEGHLTP
jgi:uncharacterized protein YjbI with pentapeptide repeats